MHAREKKSVHITKSDKATLYSHFASTVKTRISLVYLPTRMIHDGASV